MTYIDNGTFWAISIGLVIAIIVIYNNLNKKIEKVINMTEGMRKVLADGGERLAEAFREDGRKRDNDLADIYDSLSLAYNILAILQASSDKKTQAKINILVKKHTRKATQR